uniref:Uncharacterized protein n=1 Tax=Kwoniella pini CBS 10737 TaxID=1296096 RepID=A0A1B9HY66_9TREE|nr:uncharacterized protein I206_06059 [Kwoniella pini CBS 10737]OCF48191.1 hypothetical protein I206_06059 [Kwoniella pini CBS 10737]
MSNRQISPKSTIDSFDIYSYPPSSSYSKATSSSSSNSNNTSSTSTPIFNSLSSQSYELTKQISSSSSRRSSSSSSNSTEESITSQSSFNQDEPILPTYKEVSSTYFPDKLIIGNSKRKRSFFDSTSTTSTINILNTLKPRRRSSLPFIHLARRKSTQMILTITIIIVCLLLVIEIKSHKKREELWLKNIKLDEWDIRNQNYHESNLINFRKDYEFKKRLELLNDRNNKKRNFVNLEKEEDIWGPKDEELLKLEVENKWPNWWGNPDIVGKSPFDHSPIPLAVGQEKRRFMFLTDYKDYLERMNTHTYEIVDAALRHPHLIVDVWGPGWEGYDRSIPLSANIRKRAHRIAQLENSKKEFIEKQEMKKTLAEPHEDEIEEWTKPDWKVEVMEECNNDVKFDIVFTISNIFKENDPHVDALDCGALLIQQLGDCHELRCSYEWYPHANNITVSKYAFELLELFDYDKVKAKYPGWEMGLFGHSPDTGNEWDFYPVPWNEKTAKAKVFGYDGSFYPIRTTVTDSIRSYENQPNLPGDQIVTRHPHPGYTVSVPPQAREQPLETYQINHEYYETHLKLREDFANGMRTSKICVFDASLERKMIRKYAQAFLSGCVVASDLPTEHEEALSKFVIPLKSTWNIEKINEVLQYYLDNDELLQQMAMDGFIWARQHMTTTNKVSHLLKMADHHRAGSRGYEFPYGFSMRCRSYWSGGNGAYRPPWCSQDSYRGLEE